MSSPDDAHARRNLAQIRSLELAESRRLIKIHNCLVRSVDEIDDAVWPDLLDEEQLETMEDALDQLEAVADSIAADERIHDDRLLATREGSS